MNPENQSVVTCVYCGHEYPDGTPTSQHVLLTEHIKVCDKHPMRQAESELCHEREKTQKLRELLDRVMSIQPKNPWDIYELWQGYELLSVRIEYQKLIQLTK